MSEKLGFSESTIKGWEAGLGAPSLSVLVDWYIVTGCNLFKSLLDLLWPDVFFEVNENSNRDSLQKAIDIYFMKVAGNLEIERIHYLVFKDTSEKWNSLLELFCAYTHLPLSERYRIADLNQTAFNICKANGAVLVPSFDEGNHMLEEKAIRAAKESVLVGKPGYMVEFFDLSSDKIAANIMKKARLDSSFSIIQMARAMCKSARTIENWETNGKPSFLEMNMWFSILNKNMWFYLRNCLMPYEKTNIDDSSESLRNDLIQHFHAAQLRELRIFSYFALGEYGSYSNAVLEIVMKYVCLPVSMRALIARSIITGYELSKHKNMLECDNSILPNCELLKNTFALTLADIESK